MQSPDRRGARDGTSRGNGLAVSGRLGVLLVAGGLAGIAFVPAVQSLWLVLIVFGLTALPLAFLALRRDRGRGDRP